MRRTSRSQYVSTFSCPRYRYLRYEWAGRGLQPTGGGSIPTLGGTAFHNVMLSLARGVSLEEAVVRERVAFATDLRNAMLPCWRYYDHVLAEQAFWLEAAVRGYQRVRAPRIAEEFALVRAEVNEPYTLAEGLELVIKADRIERSLSDGLLYIRDYKTTRAADFRWTNKWHHEPQVYIYCDAVQTLMGEPVAGFLVEGILRGSRKEEQGKDPLWPGLRIQQSALCYGWFKNGKLSTTYSSGAVRRPLWEEMSPKEWVEELLTEDQVRGFFATVGPISPNAERLTRYRRQIVAGEERIAEWAKDIQWLETQQPSLHVQDALDDYFPQNLDACDRYGADYPCEFKPLCFNGQVEEDPLGSGLYEFRQDHHEEEE